MPITEELRQAAEKFRMETGIPSLRLHTKKGRTTVYGSKLGGTPYLPPWFPYPYNKSPGSERKPLKLLAQLNFEQLPPLEGFPREGILQFYLPFEDNGDLFGLDFDHPTQQDQFRVVYHPQIFREESQLQPPPDIDEDDDWIFPFKGEYQLTGELFHCPMTYNDFRFGREFRKYSSADQTEEETCGWICEQFNFEGHRIGGYPYFTQEDPRQEERYQDYSVLLLQIDSEGDILWGDCGVANFFIRPEKLAARDFSDILYNWDCC